MTKHLRDERGLCQRVGHSVWCRFMGVLNNGAHGFRPLYSLNMCKIHRQKSNNNAGCILIGGITDGVVTMLRRILPSRVHCAAGGIHLSDNTVSICQLEMLIGIKSHGKVMWVVLKP